MTSLRSRIFSAFLVLGLGFALSICPTSCLAAQAHVVTKSMPCHGEAGAPDHGGLRVSCCLPPSAEQLTQVVLDVPAAAAAGVAGVQRAAALDTETTRVAMSRPATHGPPPLFLAHHALLI